MKWSGVVPVLALAFTIASFWWIYLRRGRLRVTEPSTFAFVLAGPQLRIRYPLAIFNTGPAAIVVDDLRLAVEGHKLEWQTQRRTLRPSEDDILDVAAPFAVPGRQVVQVFAEFGENDPEWRPEPGRRYPVQVERKVGARWELLLAFDWWAPQENFVRYVAHRNAIGG